MKKMLGMLLLAALLAACSLAPAEENVFCDPLPQAVLSLEQRERSEAADYIAFQMPDGSARSFLITVYGSMDGFHTENGEWAMDMQLSSVDGLQRPRFVRHDPAVPRADGSTYPNALGFDLLCEETGNRISYQYDGTYFVICGWRNPAVYNGEVILRGREARYIPAGSREAEAVCTLGERADSIGYAFDVLPVTPQEGEAMAAITREAVEGAFPGYTLRGYTAYYGDHEAFACYSRVEDGVLYVKRATFTTGNRRVRVTDCMPVPLSRAFLNQLASGEWDGKLSLTGDGNLFLVDGALDTAAVPVDGRIIDSDLQQHALLLLTEDAAGVRRLCIVTKGAEGYDVAATPALPKGAYLDILHAGDGEVQFEWSVERQGETQYRTACYMRLSDGRWQLSWVQSASGVDYSSVYCGVREEWNSGSTKGVRIGSFPDGDLMSADLSSLPASGEELSARLDRSGWAVVCTPNPADRLHLRAKPDRGAKSLGKFYNGTPVQVLRQQGGWCEVAIGLDGCLTGWMMKQYLVFGEAMDEVGDAFLQVSLREEYEGRPLYTSQEMNAEHALTGEYWVVGVVGDELYILLTANGGTGYAPQSWLWEGNG